MQKEQSAKVQLKQTFPLTIKRLGINGEGVGYFKKQVVFVTGALPGEEVVVEATKVHTKFAEALPDSQRLQHQQLEQGQLPLQLPGLVH